MNSLDSLVGIEKTLRAGNLSLLSSITLFWHQSSHYFNALTGLLTAEYTGQRVKLKTHSAEFRNEWIYTLTPHYAFMACTHFTLLLQVQKADRFLIQSNDLHSRMKFFSTERHRNVLTERAVSC
jgi:hypothetical protein